MQVLFESKGLHLLDYPFPSAVLQKSKFIPVQDIVDICIDSAPPDLRVDSELLFIPATEKRALQNFVQKHKLPLIHRPDLWEALLDPYLDRSFTPRDQIRTLKFLKGYGLSEAEIYDLREEVREAMLHYNFDSMLWEWVHLGLYDVLLAMQAFYAQPKRYRNFYQRAMCIALKYSSD